MTDDTTAHDPQDAPQGEQSNTEAAKYRRRLRDAEAQLQDAQEHIRELQGSVIELSVTGKLRHADDFGRFVNTDELLDDQGRLDRERLSERLTQLVTERPDLAPEQPSRRPKPRPTPDDGTPAPSAPKHLAKGVDAIFGKADGVSWTDILHKHGEHADAARARTENHEIRVESGAGTESTD